MSRSYGTARRRPLPLAYLHSLLFGRFLGLPYVNYGGVVADGRIARALDRRHTGGRHKVRYLECGTGNASRASRARPPRGRKVHMPELPAKADVLCQALRQGP